MSITSLPTLRALCSVALVSLTLAACGGGGGVLSAAASLIAGVGSGGTGIGIITGFGSLIVDGVRRSDTGATYRSESGQATATSVPLTSAALGQSAEYTYDADGRVTDVLLSPEFAGPVTAVTATGITLLGTPISVNSDPALGPVTTFAGYASLAAVRVGDKVEAHGLLKSDGSLQATLIRQTPAMGGARISGIVSQYAGGGFSLGRHSVTVGQAAVAPSGARLANGQLVTVWSDSPPAGSVVAATAIRIKGPTAGSSNVSVSGAISAFVSSANFQIANLTVDASKATLSPSGTTLGNNRYVVVAGVFDAAANKLTATTVSAFSSEAPTTAELHGVVESYVSPSSFIVRGTRVDASAASISGGSAAQLANGVFVEIHGSMDNNAVRARSLDIQALTPTKAPTGSVIQVEGVISSYNASSRSYTLTLASGERLEGALESSAHYSNGSASNLVSGQAVQLTGVLNGATLSSEVVSFKDSSPTESGNLELSGVVYNVTSSSFMLNGLSIQINGAPISGHGALVAGARVEVYVKSVGGQYLATKIKIEDD